MVIDTSAFVAILTGEPERATLIESIEAAESRLVSAATFVESSIVIESRYGAEGLRDLDLLLTTAGVEIVPIDSDQAHAARRAFSRFGKGRHRAALTSATASPTRSRRCGVNRCCSRATTSFTPMS
jgi:ribonuclease VapC